MERFKPPSFDQPAGCGNRAANGETECVLKALDYLAVKKLRHGDVKGLFTADFCLFTSMKCFIVLKC